MIIDMAFDHDGSLLVLQYATGAVQATGGGVLIRVIRDSDKKKSDICAQYQAGTRTTVLAGLTQPTSVVVGPDGSLYVSNRGTALRGGEVIRIER